MIDSYVVKVASRCNLDCTYCYEYNLGDDTWKHQPRFMEKKTIEKLCERIVEHSQYNKIKDIHIGLHGGEPLLIGPKRLEDYLNIINNKLKDKVDFSIGIQTNGTIASRNIIDIIKKFNVGISVSLDGYKKANDRHRYDLRGKSSYGKVIKTIEKFQYHIPENFHGVLSVIDIRNDPIKTYKFFRGLKLTSFDFLLPDCNWTRKPFRISRTEPEYGYWLYKIFEEWMKENNKDVSIRFLESIVRNYFGGQSLYESMTIENVNLLTISTDGEYQGLDCLKSIPFQIYKTNKFVNNSKINNALNLQAISLRNSGEKQLCNDCLNCSSFKLCFGGYFPHRYNYKTDFLNPSVFCKDLFYLTKKISNYLDNLKLK